MSAPIGPAASGSTTVPATPRSTPAADAKSGETVYAAVARGARRASHGRLTAWTVGGGVDALGIACFVRSFWPLALPFACLASIGAWGLMTRRAEALDRAGLGGTRRARLLHAGRIAAVATGTLFAVATFYVGLWLLLGPSWTL